MSELKRSTFWTKYRVLVTNLAMTVLIALVIGCGGGGGGGNGGNGGGTGTIPSAPTGLVATAGNTQVVLTWNAVANATSYRVKRATTSGGPYTTIITALTSPSYTDTGLTNGTTYYYVASAVNAAGEGGNSNQASATPTAGGGGGPSWLPANKIFYEVSNDADPTTTDIRRIDPTGANNTLFFSVPQQFQAVTPNPNVTNQLLFAYTTNPNPGGDPNATYALYRNTSVSLSGAIKLTDEGTTAFTQIGTILFSPDGQKILFTGAIGADHALYSMNNDGTNLTRLIAADDASLSPNGASVVISQSQGAEADLFTVPISGGSATAITATTDMDEIMPQWSKDGTKVTFSARPTAVPSDPFDVFVKTVGSASAPVKVTANGDNNFSPTFSPDGTQVAYARLSFSDVALSGIYRAPITPGLETNVVLNPAVGTSVYWTSSTGRSQSAMSLPLGRSLRFRKQFPGL